jgi:hypothetical protein
VERNQHQTHRHFSGRLEHREQRRAPRPFAHRESSEVERRHPQQEQRSQHERGAEEGAARIALREHDGAKETHHHAGNQRQLER